jgi:putative transcriptional regulator
MTAQNKKTRSRILDVVHESAADLHAGGLIDKRRMREYDALCLEPIADYTFEEIKEMRRRTNLSQAVFAQVLNTSLSTIRQWEIGKKHPSGPSKKLLSLLDRKGLEALL